MAAHYDLRPAPRRNDDDKPPLLYPRIVSKGTVSTKRLVKDISEMSSFSPGDIEGLLVSLQDRIAHYLSEGHHVQLGEIGYFSMGLEGRPVEDKKEIHAQSISFGKVRFRVSPSFNQQSTGRLERVQRGLGFHQSAQLSEDERRVRLMAYLSKNPFITRREYSDITGLLKNKALDDLHLWVKKGLLREKGRGSHLVFLKADNK